MKKSNTQFTLLIRIDNRLREFNFRQRPASCYDVNVADERGTRHYFRIQGEPSAFQITGEEVSAWINDHEQPIIESLEQYLRPDSATP